MTRAAFLMDFGSTILARLPAVALIFGLLLELRLFDVASSVDLVIAP